MAPFRKWMRQSLSLTLAFWSIQTWDCSFWTVSSYFLRSSNHSSLSSLWKRTNKVKNTRIWCLRRNGYDSKRKKTIGADFFLKDGLWSHLYFPPEAGLLLLKIYFLRRCEKNHFFNKEEEENHFSHAHESVLIFLIHFCCSKFVLVGEVTLSLPCQCRAFLHFWSRGNDAEVE